MKTIYKLSWKMLKRNKTLNAYIIIQMAAVFAMTIFMVSSITSRFKYYSPFKDYIEKDGYFCNLTSATSILGKYVQKPSDISDSLNGVEASDVQASYRVNISEKNGDNMYSLFSYSYDEGLYNNWIPNIQDGKWLSDIDQKESEEIPVVVYDTNHSIEVGDVLEKQSIEYIVDEHGKEGNITKFFKLKVVGILDDDAEIVYYNKIEYGDCRDAFSSVKQITKDEGYETLYLFRNKDTRSANVFSMSSGIAFINISDSITKEMQDKNQEIILGITDNFMDLRTFKQNSNAYITEEINKLLPIFVCILLLTLIITVSVNAITTYKEITNFALYYICGITWKKTMLISFIHAVIQTVLALFTAIIGMLICSAASLLSNTVLEFHPLQILVCLAMICVNLIFAFIMPFIIIRNNTPKEILTSN